MKHSRMAISILLPVMMLPSFHSMASTNQNLSLTIYNKDLALIQDKRTIDIGSGISRIELKDVSAKIYPETVAFVSPGVAIVEQNFDFDLLTPEKLMQKSVGRQIHVIRINPGTGAQTTDAATVLSVNNGVVLRIGDHIETLNADAIPTRVIFDRIPDNLRASPTLSITVDSKSAGPHNIALSYLSGGLSWQADYVALLDEQSNKLDLQGWITLSNHSGTSFENVETQLVAGKISSERSDLYENNGRFWRSSQSSDDNQSGASPFADYYVYTLPNRTTIANEQTKQVGFLENKGISAQKSYRYQASKFESSDDPENAEVVIQFKNSSGQGLNAPLPAGVVRVYVRDAAGIPKFIGENRIDHTPRDSVLGIKTGEAFDVTVQPTLLKNEVIGSKKRRYSMEYLVRNARNDDMTIEIEQSTARDGKIINENFKSTRVDAYRWSWSVPVKAHDEVKLAFELEARQP